MGTSWAPSEPPAILEPYGYGLLAYDNRRGREVLVASVRGSEVGETWEWDGRSWRRVATEHSPLMTGALGQGQSAAYSPDLRAVVVQDFAHRPDYIKTWLFDGSDWTSISTAHQPDTLIFNGISSPTALQLEYDETRHSIVALSIDDFRTWIFDGRDWTALPINGPTPAIPLTRGVGVRQRPAAALDKQRDVWVFFGGFDGNTFYSDTWEGDGRVWTKLSPPTSPTGREEAQMAWDPIGHRMVLFGGWATLTGGLADTWAWNGTFWTNLAG